MRKCDVLDLLEQKLIAAHRTLNTETSSTARCRARAQFELLIELQIAIEKMGTKKEVAK